MDEERRGVTLHDNDLAHHSYEHEQAAANAQAQAGAPIQMGSNGYPVSFVFTSPLILFSFSFQRVFSRLSSLTLSSLPLLRSDRQEASA